MAGDLETRADQFRPGSQVTALQPVDDSYHMRERYSVA